MGNLMLKSVKNAMLIGNYKTINDRHIKEGLLLRSGKLSDLSDEDMQVLIDKYNLQAVVDFRSEDEVKKSPDRPIEGVVNTWVKVDNTKSSTVLAAKYTINDLEKNSKGIAEYIKKSNPETMYLNIIDSELGQKGLAEFFNILLNDNNGAVLWHCSAGKDRTGLAAVLLLLALGVDNETALKEFERVNDNNIAYRNKLEATFAGKIEDEETLQMVLTFITGVSRKYMQNALDLIDSKYGGIDSFLLNQLKLTEEKRNKLIEKYTV